MNTSMWTFKGSLELGIQENCLENNRRGSPPEEDKGVHAETDIWLLSALHLPSIAPALTT